MEWKTRIQSLIDAGIQLDAIAARMEVTPNALREILAGRTKAPRAAAAFRLAALTPASFRPRKRARRRA
ncbi:hypothetical protein Psesu_1139 [Pseudoxanthomonas suwonensis 11-1]|uniref:HTH cro/C1-type domain-containing protein n=1 Tax=Pseudoxanthomonas suwonensis (strain 11-1) TaxID=743721 RepID=E6WS40_PSEUU|nr:hypothetical protein [Pseudoxanthomonas suwonensis]ADV26989.1 hypothetical protein Psesu_1139 [Pseudoxanthomonas suwonensis 11-1]